MSLSVHPLSSQPAERLMREKEEIENVYTQLLDIPEEKLLFTQKLAEGSVSKFYSDKDNLRWVLQRIRQRIQEAKQAFQDAIQRMDDGVLDLSRRSLCDLTIKDCYDCSDIRTIILSGNHLKTLPPLCRLKPYLKRVEAIGNIEDIERLFKLFLTENRTNFDLFQVFYAIYDKQDNYKPAYRHLYEEVTRNADKVPLSALAIKVDELMDAVKPDIKVLSIHPHIESCEKFGGVRGFIDLHYFLNLEELDLSGCQLERHIPFRWLSELANIKKLNLSHTPITALPDGLQNKPIEELNVSNTNITELPAWIANLTRLKRLNIAETRINNLPTCIQQIPLESCILEGTLIETLPRFHQNIEELSIKRTPIKQIPSVLLALLKKRKIQIDESNVASLQLQARVSAAFDSSVVASWVFNAERYRENDTMISCLKTSVVKVHYISIIAFLIMWQLSEALILSVPAPCQMRAHVQSDKFRRFRERNLEQRNSLIYLLFLFQFLSLARRWQDIKATSRFMMS